MKTWGVSWVSDGVVCEGLKGRDGMFGRVDFVRGVLEQASTPFIRGFLGFSVVKYPYNH